MTALKPWPRPGTDIHRTTLDYRPDIDGLRAVAVLSVVLFHAFPTSATGGFAGVDVFFVISGFLISSLLIGDLRLQRFSIRTFYERRITRIFPALITVLIASLAFGWLALLADEYALLGKHTLAGAGFVSNIMLWSEDGYFDVAAETKPLLHLWSLGVEEQFYLVWPLALWAIWKLRASLIGCVAAIAALSFVVNLHAAAHHPVVDFYWPHTRFWELLAGALLACLPARAALDRPGVAHLASCIGAALLGATFVYIDSGSVFPGMLALLPVTGTALLIHAGPTALVNRLLSHPVLVWIGLISYPLYLWHWPLLSFGRIIEGWAMPTTVRAAAVLLAVALAWATYRFIETPLRRAPRRFAVTLLAGLMVCVAWAGWIVARNDGFADRLAAKPVELYPNGIGQQRYLEYLRSTVHPCANAELLDLAAKSKDYGMRCFQSQPSGPIDLLLIGDSHAEHLLPGFAEVFKDRNVASFMHYDLPIVDSRFFLQSIPLIARDPNIRAIAVSGYWASKIKPEDPSYEQRLRKTFELLAANKRTVYVLGDVPTFPFVPERCKYSRRFKNGDNICSYSLREYLKQRTYYLEVLGKAVQGLDNVKLLIPDQFFCDANSCNMAHDDMLLYRDHHHLNVDGSIYLVRALREQSGLTLPQ